MKRKIALLLLSITCFFTSSTYAAIEYQLNPGVSVDYELPPGTPVVFANIFFWPITAICTIVSDTPNNIVIRMLKKKGSVNDIPLTVGDIMDFPTNPGDKLKIFADSGAKVELTNTGLEAIKASCAPAT